jgi:hypothetical protein
VVVETGAAAPVTPLVADPGITFLVALVVALATPTSLGAAVPPLNTSA